MAAKPRKPPADSLRLAGPPAEAEAAPPPQGAPGAAEEGQGPLMPFSYAALVAWGRGNLAVAAAANAALAQGLEAVGRELMACAREALTSAIEAAHGFLGVKTLEDVVALQADFARRNLDGMLTGTVKLSEIGCALAAETIAPLGGRVGAAAATKRAPFTA